MASAGFGSISNWTSPYVFQRGQLETGLMFHPVIAHVQYSSTLDLAVCSNAYFSLLRSPLSWLSHCHPSYCKFPTRTWGSGDFVMLVVSVRVFFMFIQTLPLILKRVFQHAVYLLVEYHPIPKKASPSSSSRFILSDLITWRCLELVDKRWQRRRKLHRRDRLLLPWTSRGNNNCSQR